MGVKERLRIFSSLVHRTKKWDENGSEEFRELNDLLDYPGISFVTDLGSFPEYCCDGSTRNGAFKLNIKQNEGKGRFYCNLFGHGIERMNALEKRYSKYIKT